MSNEDGSEDRLTKTEFAELIQHLSIQEIVAIEYRIGKNWRKLFTRKSVTSNAFACNLCTLETSSFKDMLSHIDGRKHKLQMDRVQQLYHPDYTHPKHYKDESTIEKSEIATKATSNVIGITPSNKVENAIKSSAAINSGPIITAASKTPAVVETKNTKNIKPTMGKKSSLVKDAKSISKTVNVSEKTEEMKINTVVNKDQLNNNDNSAKTKDVSEKTKEMETNTVINKGQLNNGNDKNSKIKSASNLEKEITKNNANLSQEKQLLPKTTSSATANGGNVELASKAAINIENSNSKQIAPTPAAPTDGLNSINDKKNVGNSKESTLNENCISSSLVKNPFAFKIQEKQKHNDNENKEDVPQAKDGEKMTAAIGESSSKKSTINVTDGKRPLTHDASFVNKATGGGATEAKKAKIFLNPAAALSEKAASSSDNEKGKRISRDSESEKPQYQTDKILIPTKHKPSSKSSKDNKASPPRAVATMLPSQNKDLPKFSVKTYSSKPSDNDVLGILGVEYVIKILKSRWDISPRYECGLCELVFDGFAMQCHLEGYRHRLKFCEKHFPTAVRHYRQYMHSVPEHELFKVMTPVLAKLATAIEQHHGRNLPYECYERDFSLNRHEILAKAFSCRHASEQYGPTFTHVVGAKEIDNYINEKHKFMAPATSRTAIFDSKIGNRSSRFDSRHDDKDSVTRDRHRHVGRGGESTSAAISSSPHVETPYKSYMSSTGYSDLYPRSNAYPQYQQPVVSEPAVRPVDDETHKLMVEDFLKGTLKGGRPRDNRKRSVSPTQTSSMSAKRKSLSPLRQNDIWQAYRHMVDQELNNLDERFKEYRKDPETHPSYNEEWQKFWKRRKDELIAAGLDHRKYNYQPEWVRFIKVRIEELFSQEVENLKIKSRERLCLPMTNNNLSNVKYHVQAPKMNPSDMITSSETTNAVNAPNNAMASNLSNTAMSPNASGSSPQVVSVLRLMTALEENLGSLGPKIIDLLSKALQAEKISPTQVNALILNDENCALVETAKEKLKGLVIAGLFDGSKNRLMKKVVRETEALLSYAQQFRRASAVQSAKHPAASNLLTSSATVSAVSNTLNTLKHQAPIQSTGGGHKTSSASSSSIGTQLTHVDKKELASKLAASLVAQGKTDFDPQQLQQLIAVYTLIEKKKRTATALSNKVNSMAAAAVDAATSSKKNSLSDMLSDLLKSTSSTSQVINNSVSKPQNNLSTSAEESTYRMSTQRTSNSSAFHQSNFSNAVGGYPSNSSFTSVSQNSGGNYFSNTTQSTGNAIGVSGAEGGGLSGHANYGLNYSNNMYPHYQQQTSNPNDMMYNNLYQNTNNMRQNWDWNTNMGTNPNYNMGGAPSSNSDQSSNW